MNTACVGSASAGTWSRTSRYQQRKVSRVSTWRRTSHGGRGFPAPAHKARARGQQRCSLCILGCDRGSQGEERRRSTANQRHRPGNRVARERHICARTAANGQEARSLPRDCTDGPRTVACRGGFGPPRPNTQSRRSTDHREGHSHPSQGPMARMVERTSVMISPFRGAPTSDLHRSSSSLGLTLRSPRTRSALQMSA